MNKAKSIREGLSNENVRCSWHCQSKQSSRAGQLRRIHTVQFYGDLAVYKITILIKEKKEEHIIEFYKDLTVYTYNRISVYH